MMHQGYFRTCPACQPAQERSRAANEAWSAAQAWGGAADGKRHRSLRQSPAYKAASAEQAAAGREYRSMLNEHERATR